MAETYMASAMEAAPTRTVPEMAALSSGMNEELVALRAIVAAGAQSTGEQYFQAVVRHLASAVDAHYAFIAEFASPATRTRVRTVAFWAKNRIAETLEWDVAGTPCEEVVRGNLCHHPTGVRQKFPEDRLLVEWGIESYLGLPLRDSAGTVLGHIAVSDERPMSEEPQKLLTFGIFQVSSASESNPRRDRSDTHFQLLPIAARRDSASWREAAHESCKT